jgi:two-component system NtrC family response regulator
MARILIVDDDRDFCQWTTEILKGAGHDPSYALTMSEGRRSVEEGLFDIVFLDVRLPDGYGLDLVPNALRSRSEPEVIIITGNVDPDGAELAMKSGVWDYLKKPFARKELEFHVSRAMQYRNERSAYRGRLALKVPGIVGSSSQLVGSLDLLAVAASSDASVLITGETGTGKELFARAIHANSGRAGGNFVVVDCAALPETLVESTLFGHVKGAFTGADKSSNGLIRQSHLGTLFLDEVGELPINVQKSFLRVLQEGAFRPVGGTKEINVDFRLIAATNKDLGKMAKEGTFRQDLFYRLGTLAIGIPPLRDRREDVVELVFYYIPRICRRYDAGTLGYDPGFLQTLLSYHWPGNVRELVHCLEATISGAQGQTTLFSRNLPPDIRAHAARSSIEVKTSVGRQPPWEVPVEKGLPTLKDYRESMDKTYLERLTGLNELSVGKACELSGLSRSRLYSLFKKHRISPNLLHKPS